MTTPTVSDHRRAVPRGRAAGVEDDAVITDTDRLRWLAENTGSARSFTNGTRNAVAWWPRTEDEWADRLGTIRGAIDRKILEERQETAR